MFVEGASRSKNKVTGGHADQGDIVAVLGQRALLMVAVDGDARVPVGCWECELAALMRGQGFAMTNSGNCLGYVSLVALIGRPEDLH
jgi:hypothetical protein